MMLDLIKKTSKDLYDLKTDFRRKINEKLLKMGLYSFSRIYIESNYVDLTVQRKMSEFEIEALEKEFNMKMTRYECKRVYNIDEPLDPFCDGECKFYLYRFR